MSTPIRRISPRFCARAAIGHAIKPTTTPIKSRRLIVVPEAQETTSYRLKLVHRRGTGTRAVLRSRMSALGQKQTSALQNVMSALHPIATANAKFRKRPCPLYPRKRTCAVQEGMSALGQKRTHAAQRSGNLFDHLVGASGQ